MQVAKYAKENLARKRPDIQFVGEDLTPLAQTRDFAPYIAKIKASGADSIITGNWGSDLTLLMKAANDAGLNARFFTYYAGVSGTPTAMGASMAGDRVYQVSYNHSAMTGEARMLMDDYKKRFNDDWYTGAVYHAFSLLSTAMVKAKSTEPVKVAAAMEGLKFKSFNGDVEMRATDHQMQQTIYITQWTKDRRQAQRLQRREHRLQLPAGEDLRAVCQQHAHVVPDEAPRQRLSLTRQPSRPGLCAGPAGARSAGPLSWRAGSFEFLVTARAWTRS